MLHQKYVLKFLGTGLALFFILLSSDTFFLLLDIVSMPNIEVRSNEDFPCKGHNCGCQSALACKNSCCCFPSVKKVNIPKNDSLRSKETQTKNKVLIFSELAKCQGFSYSGILYPRFLFFNDLKLQEEMVFLTRKKGFITPLFSKVSSVYLDVPEAIPKL